MPTVRSIVIDRPPLLAHRVQFAVEISPSETKQEGLTPDEAELYRDLVEERFGRSVRLEQSAPPSSRSGKPSIHRPPDLAPSRGATTRQRHCDDAPERRALETVFESPHAALASSVRLHQEVGPMFWC